MPVCKEHMSAILDTSLGYQCQEGGEYITDQEQFCIAVAYLFTWDKLVDRAFEGHEYLLDDGE